MKKFIISSAAIAMAMAMTATAMAADGDSLYFKDVTATNYGWAVEYIDYIAKNGIASGVGSDMYAPGSNIERGDFAVLVDKTFTFKAGKLVTYALRDVPETSYYAQAIANCCAAGVITERGAYYPEDAIKRIDAIVMIYRALNSNSLVTGLSTDISMFTDAATVIGAERQAAAGTLYKIGIINGDDNGNLNPDATMTRAEMAVVFTKLDKYIKDYEVEAARIAEEKAEQEKIAAAEKEETEKEEAKQNESRNYSSEDVSETIVASNGGAISVDNCTVKVNSDNAVSVDNSSEVDISASNITSVGGNGINAANNSTVKLNNGKITATNGNSVYASSESTVTVNGTELNADGNSSLYAASVNDEAKIEISNSKINSGDSLGAIKVANGGKIDLDNCVITASTGTGKATYTGAIDIISTNDNESVINIDNTTINNKKGAAFYIRESDVTINLKNCNNNINVSTLINSPEIVKQSQERGNNITLNLTDNTSIQNTNIILDNKTVLNLYIGEGCTLSGQIDTETRGYINLEMDRDGYLLLDSDLYLDGFKDGDILDFRNIEDNGYNIYYNISNPDNDWLLADTYDLMTGGKLIPYTKQEIYR